MQRNLTTFVCLSAVVMSLGWGLRGTIGGGPFGAMIPGAMIGLCLCLLLDLKNHVHLIAAMGAIGIGIGGQMTYGQTIGFIREPATFWWGLTGLTLKGAAWGLVGGVILGMGFVIQKYSRKEVLLCLLLMVLGTLLGWAAIDYPRLIYFSNRLDKPREELLIGMFLGAVGFMAIPWLRHRERFTLEMGLWGLLFGGLGFGGGGLFMAISGRVPQAYRGLPYWKGMEFTFGALLGVGYAIACYRNRAVLQAENQSIQEQTDFVERLPRPARFSLIVVMILCSLSFNFVLSEFRWVPTQGMYTILGCALLALTLKSEFLAGHLAMSLTVVAFFRDFVADALKMKSDNAIQVSPLAIWGIVFLLTLPVVAYASLQFENKEQRTARELLLLTWVGTVDCFAKYFFLFKLRGGYDHMLVPAVFLVELVITTYLVLSLSHSRKTAESVS